MDYSYPFLYENPYRYENDGYLYNPYFDQNVSPSDERFFPFLPFVAGLAIGPLLLAPFFLNRPCCPPYGPGPYGPGPVPYGAAPYAPMYQPYAAMTPVASNYAPNNGGITENINIITK